MAFYEGGRAGAPTVVLLHGYSADRTIFVRFASRLKDDYHLILPDLAGHGATPYLPDGDHSAPAQAQRVAGLLDHLGVERAHVMGNSMGGFVAATFGLRHPERTISLCLSDAVGVHSPFPSVVETMIRGGRNPFLLERVQDFPAFYRMTMAKPPFVPGPVKAAMAREYVTRREALEAIFAAFHEQDYLDDHLAEITAPTLVMWGERDLLVHPSAGDGWAHGLPHARQLTYPDIGHMPMIEIPRRSAEDYRTFLREVEPRS